MDGKTMKIGEFAAKYGVTDRHARRLAAEHEADLVGHIEKKGNVGTWIDEYAEAYLRDLLRNPLEILPAELEEADPAELQRELNDMTRRWAEAEKRASMADAAAARLEAAEQRVLLLEDVHAEAMSRRDAEHKAELANLKASYVGQIGALEGANRILQDNIEKAREQLREADERTHVAEADCQEAERTLEQMRREAKMRADEAQDAEEQRVKVELKLEKIRAKTAELAAAKWPWQRARILRELAALQAEEKPS